MPNYGLVASATYNPMSFDDYMKPFTMYNEAYNQAMDYYDALALQSAGLERLAESEMNTDSYEEYQSYKEALSSAANELANNGLKGARKNLSNLRRQYAQKIQPLEKAMEYQAKLTEDIWKMNPTGDMVFTFDPMSMPVSYFVKNPNARPQGYSLSEWEKRGYEHGVQASSRAPLSIDKSNKAQYLLAKQGYSADAVAKFLAEKSPELQSILDELYTNMETQLKGLSSIQVEDFKKRALLGMVQGLTMKESPLADPAYSSPLDWSKFEFEKDKYKAALAASESTLPYNVIEYETDGVTPKIIHWTGGHGTVGEIGTPVLKDGKIVSVNPIKQDGKVVSYNSSKDEWDIKKQRVIVDGKVNKKAQSAQKVAQVLPVIYTAGSTPNVYANYKDFELALTSKAKEISYNNLPERYKNQVKSYLKQRGINIDKMSEEEQNTILQSFEYRLFIYKDAVEDGDFNNNADLKKLYTGIGAHSTFGFYPRSKKDVIIQQNDETSKKTTTIDGVPVITKNSH